MQLEKTPKELWTTVGSWEYYGEKLSNSGEKEKGKRIEKGKKAEKKRESVL